MNTANYSNPNPRPALVGQLIQPLTERLTRSSTAAAPAVTSQCELAAENWDASRARSELGYSIPDGHLLVLAYPAFAHPHQGTQMNRYAMFLVVSQERYNTRGMLPYRRAKEDLIVADKDLTAAMKRRLVD